MTINCPMCGYLFEQTVPRCPQCGDKHPLVAVNQWVHPEVRRGLKLLLWCFWLSAVSVPLLLMLDFNPSRFIVRDNHSSFSYVLFFVSATALLGKVIGIWGKVKINAAPVMREMQTNLLISIGLEILVLISLLPDALFLSTFPYDRIPFVLGTMRVFCYTLDYWLLGRFFAKFHHFSGDQELAERGKSIGELAIFLMLIGVLCILAPCLMAPALYVLIPIALLPLVVISLLYLTLLTQTQKKLQDEFQEV